MTDDLPGRPAFWSESHLKIHQSRTISSRPPKQKKTGKKTREEHGFFWLTKRADRLPDVELDVQDFENYSCRYGRMGFVHEQWEKHCCLGFLGDYTTHFNPGIINHWQGNAIWHNQDLIRKVIRAGQVFFRGWNGFKTCSLDPPQFWFSMKHGEYIYSRWWFQTFFIFTPIWGRFPTWLIFFKWVETTT